MTSQTILRRVRLIHLSVKNGTLVSHRTGRSVLNVIVRSSFMRASHYLKLYILEEYRFIYTVLEWVKSGEKIPFHASKPNVIMIFAVPSDTPWHQ